MDSRQAREILQLYRPGSTDAADPLVAEALDVVKRDLELAAWFEKHCAITSAIRSKLREVTPPPGLKRQIILGRAEHVRIAALPRVLRNIAMAAAVLIIGVILFATLNTTHENTFEVFRSRMGRKVLDGYFMDITATNQAEIRQFFQSRQVPVDYALTKPLQELPAFGAAVFKFYDQPVELLCLSDVVQPNGPTNAVWVFVTSKSVLRDPPPAGKTEIAQVDKLKTYGWTKGDKVYLLAGYGDESSLKKLLE
jgi:hypothetical protein